ncbi:YjcQ family protein [Jeotgalibacillus malaysiensis]|uniref:YjcQ family protein n=1 Tax=Jeotgalibacillus malaysiensis TaxID=1508404 RepID=UPI00384DAE98
MNKQKLRYAILKEFDNGNKNISDADFPVEQNEFDEAVRFLGREGYIRGVGYADNRPYFLQAVHVTEKGEKYLSENSAWSKVYKGIKEIKGFIK